MRRGIAVENRTFSMTEGPLFGPIIKFAIPVVLTGVLQLFFSAADLAVVGRYGSPFAVGAVGATSNLINLIISFFLGMSVGSGVSAAHAKGSGEEERLSRVVHTAIPLSLICGVVLTVIGVLFSKDMLALMDTPDGLLDLSATYLKIYFGGITAMMIYNFGASILRAVGDTKRPLIILVISGVCNVILNLIFVIVLHLDVAGVAIATTISQVVSAVCVVITLMRREDGARFFISKMKIYKEQVAYICRIGFPAGLQGTLFAISNVIIQAAENSFGSEAIVSGSSAAASIEGFIWMIGNGFVQAAITFVGQNVGARKFDRVGKIAGVCLLCAGVGATVVGVGAYMFGRPLLLIYTKNLPEAVEYGLIRLLWMCCFNGLCGMMDVLTGVMRGMGKSITPMFITVVGACLSRIVWIYTVFAHHHTLPWLFVSYPITWAATFFIEVIAYFIIKRNMMKKAGVIV